MKSFVALNFVAGFLHYLFLVVASKQLTTENFSALSAWLAFLSFAFIGSAVLQYLSCFVPLSRRHIKIFIAAGLLYAVAVALLPFAFTFDHTMIGVLAGLMACVFGIFLGQAQVRLLFLGLGAGNFMVALAKLLFGVAPLLALPSGERYFWAVPMAYVPGVLLMSFVLLKHREEAPRTKGTGQIKEAIVSTVVLGAGSALFPQFELMLMRTTQSTDAFNAFARLSLFYKAIFFVFLIFSQWLLPYQLRDPKRAGKALSDPRLYAGAVALAGAAALLGPLVAIYALRWAESPSHLQIFLSCWNMGLLTWMFLLLQDLCAKRRNLPAVLALGGVFVIAPAQLLLGLPVIYYFTAAILWNTFIIWRTVTFADEANLKSSLPLNAA